jgi:cytoskeletal protein CcmA (bactofilin family)
MFGSRKNKISGRIETLISKDARIRGDIEFSGGLHLDGAVVGNVRATPGQSATLWVSEHGCVEGTVEVPKVVLNGSVKGDIEARERIVLSERARVQGNVKYGAVEMALGAEVTGKLIPTGKALAQPAVPVAAGAPPNLKAVS